MSKTTKSIGDSGEDKASEYLTSHGFEIVERNWRTKYCEIDIIAKKVKRIFFVEVKSRGSDTYGTGLEYITSKKMRQMRFAAEMWVQVNKWGGEYQLAAIGITEGEITFVDSF